MKFDPKSLIIVRKSEPVQDVANEVDCFFYQDLSDWLVLDPLGKLVDCYQHMIESSWSYVLVFLNDHRVIRKRTEDTVVALHPESIQGIEIS